MRVSRYNITLIESGRVINNARGSDSAMQDANDERGLREGAKPALLDSVPSPPRGRLPHAARPASCPGHRARSLGHYTTKPLLIPSSPLRRGPYTIYRHIVLQRPSPNAMPPNNLPTPTPRRSRPSRSSRRPSNPDTHADWVLYPAGSPREGVQPGSMSSYANTITNARPPDMPLVR